MARDNDIKLLWNIYLFIGPFCVQTDYFYTYYNQYWIYILVVFISNNIQRRVDLLLSTCWMRLQKKHIKLQQRKKGQKEFCTIVNAKY